MNMLDWIKTIWQYNYWGRDKLWQCVQSISHDDYMRPVEYSMGSVHQQIVHTMWAEHLWYSRINNMPRITYTADDFADREAVWQQWQEVQSLWMNTINTITQTQIDETFIAKATSGDYTQTVGQVLLHVVNHSTDHRAQILRLIHDYGGETFQQDMIFYFREQAHE